MTYFLVKFIHVSAAIIWIGSILATSILNILMVQKKDTAGLISLSRQEEFLGKYIVGPSAIVTLLAGIAMSVFLGFGWPLWVIWGFAVIILTGILGGTFARKVSSKITAVAKADDIDHQQLQMLQRKFTVLSSITIILLFSAVWVMIFKPTF